jgi:molybdate transport system substrate-binding protein
MKTVVSLLFCALMVASSNAQEITVAAAADLRPALDEIVSRFQAETGQAKSGVHVKAIYGSSGNFYQQIQNGAPFDIFFSANTDYPKKLESAGLVVPGSYHEYARGKIVLLIQESSSLDLKRGMKLLLDPGVKKIAIADPSHAPYGQAAVAALKSENIYGQVSGKLVTAENISQAASFVLSGAADAGIIALSIAMSAPESRARFVEIPMGDYAPIQQACVILGSSQNQELAAQFQSYIRSEQGRAILKRHGFEVPDAGK